ncbi:hypothetical protein VIGAN_10183900 [Vigna angularis var. angularis]|uniref:Uncharacterized protein n=1 Tax=Vigna angularis var. angularis TaxID=157739 RepID=A0A0S3T5X9_PHAAN|nr:hypothetical protein VIGAN_10183900 [Vigna angularis var. angularis]
MHPGWIPELRPAEREVRAMLATVLVQCASYSSWSSSSSTLEPEREPQHSVPPRVPELSVLVQGESSREQPQVQYSPELAPAASSLGSQQEGWLPGG